ncbi:hypothetical protein BD780_003500 [Clostridium tetanomorphum]|uniref:hypothetical protein n=1 Tax=Clostridium tetanomorphum TaxID=1553 RepID=UPI00044893ED|nr:hypothetical protein [Clostridium tetanomorphum]KAJ49373.1 hypothetical protein CTM_23434 [Clostridium tetanomorphum DSM 665]KAJ51212.1 hypothetical protein CTM_13868 [Clostridium tetanomorphum DSM 665]MBP1863699.1 hypothetical protein [Clostridium tetanomorphum]NRS86275.1 hypothetical protein [Clostridium tetanomorphum]SQC00717.1 Uncharacterised protein [Clostridium tetanomorphum]
MNNFEVIIDNTVFFIQTTANKEVAMKILTRYYLLNKFKATDQELKDFFISCGYNVITIPYNCNNFDRMIKSKNYQVIDLSSIDTDIKNTLLSN